MQTITCEQREREPTVRFILPKVPVLMSAYIHRRAPSLARVMTPAKVTEKARLVPALAPDLEEATLKMDRFCLSRLCEN